MGQGGAPRARVSADVRQNLLARTGVVDRQITPIRATGGPFRIACSRQDRLTIFRSLGPDRENPAMETLSRNWGWLLALGILMIILGVFAIAAPYGATLAVQFALGWILV